MSLRVARLRTYEDFLRYSAREAGNLARHMDAIQALVPPDNRSFTVPGYSYTAGRQVDFLVDFQHSPGPPVVNWRERVLCPLTYFNNRMRATIHAVDMELGLHDDSTIYATEQVTPMYAYFAGAYPATVGSEYLGAAVPRGAANAAGVRNEDLTALTFADDSFDAVVSLDVLEHIPDFMAAFRECHRVLRPDGHLFWSVPFVSGNPRNTIRARLTETGIEHILPPEYHGDPLTTEGCLCFTHFGWEMLDDVRRLGFRDVYALCMYSLEFGYLGGYQLQFVARK
ncbi:class I SAM-dependent methyltransferase [Prosthecomicrobium sp. N25]|uniref:class I SAM-dependent methyltransferase n=1 Tax=Prosthecomicrobium sp. N25 TaxID=3129254 RepID=UPI0030776FC3